MAEQYKHVPWRAIAGMRNRVIHGYFEVDYEIVWTAAIDEVPALAEQVRRVLQQLTEEDDPAG